MKIQIRQGMFETNSSSTHAICIGKEGKVDFPKELTFSLDGQFGWEWEIYNDINSKASYLYIAIVDSGSVSDIGENINDTSSKVEKISNWLKEDNIKFKFDSINVQFGFYGAYLNIPGYIDHGYELIDFVNWILESKDHLYSYLFNSSSCICTGNDNEDNDLNIPNNNYEIIFEKGN